MIFLIINREWKVCTRSSGVTDLFNLLLFLAIYQKANTDARLSAYQFNKPSFGRVLLRD
jgi:hypothetical protein